MSWEVQTPLRYNVMYSLCKWSWVFLRKICTLKSSAKSKRPFQGNKGENITCMRRKCGKSHSGYTNTLVLIEQCILTIMNYLQVWSAGLRDLCNTIKHEGTWGSGVYPLFQPCPPMCTCQMIQFVPINQVPHSHKSRTQQLVSASFTTLQVLFWKFAKTLSDLQRAKWHDRCFRLRVFGCRPQSVHLPPFTFRQRFRTFGRIF